MEIKFTPQFSHWSPAQVVAQAYGTDSYSSNSYNGPTTTSITPGAPNTGFFTEPTPTNLSILLTIAIAIGVVSFLSTRAVRRYLRRK